MTQIKNHGPRTDAQTGLRTIRHHLYGSRDSRPSEIPSATASAIFPDYFGPNVFAQSLPRWQVCFSSLTLSASCSQPLQQLVDQGQDLGLRVLERRRSRVTVQQPLIQPLADIILQLL